MKNMHSLDRFVRALLGIALLVLGFFWLADGLRGAAYALAVVMLLTAVAGYCPLYRWTGLRTRSSTTPQTKKSYAAVAAVVLIAAAVGASYASIFLTRKVFLEDFNAMNDHYKQTLFLTGKGQRSQAKEKYDRLMPAYAAFVGKYSSYRPWALRGDAQWSTDLATVDGILKGIEAQVRTGDLQAAHLELEKVRTVFQDVFKRNGFSMLSVALVDFHDAMELMLEAATAKRAQALADLYPQVNGKLQAIEAEANDAEIQTIRKNLDALAALAAAGSLDALPAAGDALKTSFVKVYLQRG